MTSQDRSRYSAPRASVLMAVRNRADHLASGLPLILDSAAAAEIPAEVVVVDNGSTDQTPDLLASYAARYPQLVPLREERPGKSRAIALGLSKVRGDVVLFTDDDVRVPSSWVTDMAEPVLSGRADAVSGRVQLAEYLDRPWLTDELRVSLAEFVDVSGPYPGMVGANMAASTAAVRAVGFDDRLGPGANGFADDVLFNLQLKANGYRVVGSAGPPVIHNVDVDRLTYRRMADLAVRNGSSHAYLWHHWLHSDLRFVRTRLLRDRARLIAERATHRQDKGGEGIRLNEYQLLYRTTFFRQLLAERKLPPRYGGKRLTAAAIASQ